MQNSKLVKYSYITIAAICLSLLFASPSFAVDRNDLELLPLVDSNNIEACGQKINSVIDYKVENLEVSKTFLFAAIDDGTMPQICKDNPSGSSPTGVPCVYRFPYQAELGDSHMLRFLAQNQPNVYLFVAGLINASEDRVYSKVKSYRFTPCTHTTPMVNIVPGNGSFTEDTVAPRGNASNRLYSVKPLARWISSNYGIFGDAESSSEFVVSVATRADNIEKVVFEVRDVNDHIGHVNVLASQKRIDLEAGVEAYVAKINKNAFDAGKLTIRAFVIPTVGLPLSMSGPLTSPTQRSTDEHEISVYNNKDSSIVRKHFYIETTGADVAGCGTLAFPCATMNGAIDKAMNAGVTDFSGATLHFGEGTFAYGCTDRRYPGPHTDKATMIFEGKMTSNGKKLTTINRGLDLSPWGWNGQQITAVTKAVFKNFLIRKDPTSSNPRAAIIGIGDNYGVDTSFLVENIDFKGLGRNPGTCLTENLPFSAIYAEIRDSYMAGFQGNGAGEKNIRNFVSCSSIAYSNSATILNSAAKVDQTVGGCTIPGSSPHGDLMKSYNGHLYVNGFWSTLESLIVSQGLFIQDSDVDINNVHVTVGGPNEPSIAAAFLFGKPDGAPVTNVTFRNSTFDNGPRRNTRLEAGLGAYPGTSVIRFINTPGDSNTPFLVPDNAHTWANTSSNPYYSSASGLEYSREQ